MIFGVAIIAMLNLISFGNFQNSNVNEAECPILPWMAVTRTMEEARAQTTVIFFNESAGACRDRPRVNLSYPRRDYEVQTLGYTQIVNHYNFLTGTIRALTRMPYSMLTEPNADPTGFLTKFSLFDCFRFAAQKNLSRRIVSFFKDLKDKCMRMSCTFLVLCNHHITQQITETMIDFNLFRPWTLWIAPTDAILQQLQEENLGATGVPIAIPLRNTSSNSTQNECTDAMVVYSKSNNRIQQLAVFTPEVDNEIRQQIFLAGTAGEVNAFRLLNLLNDTINVGVKQLPPFLELDFADGNFTNIRYKGICVKILEAFADIMNFSYNLIPYDTIGYKSYIDGEEIWSGLIGDAIDNKIDLALGALSITQERATVVDFTTHFLVDSSAILSHKPETASRVLIFFQVFPWQVWILLFVATLVVGPSLAITEHVIETKSFKNCVKDSKVGNTWWALGSSIIQQGDLEVTSTSGRMLAVFWLFFIIILIGTYTGLLLAFVSFPGTKVPIESLQQLTSSDSPFPLALRPSATETYIKEGSSWMTEAISQRWQQRPNIEFPQTPNKVLDHLNKDSHALLSEKLTFQYIIALQLNSCQCCPFYESHYTFLKHYYSFIVPKNSALLGSFNVILQRLIESGIIAKWLQESLPDVSQCITRDSKSNDDSHRAMTLTDLQGAFYILTIGVSLAIFALIVEIGYRNSNTVVVFKKVIKFKKRR